MSRNQEFGISREMNKYIDTSGNVNDDLFFFNDRIKHFFTFIVRIRKEK